MYYGNIMGYISSMYAIGWEVVLGMSMYKLLVLIVGNGWELGNGIIINSQSSSKTNNGFSVNAYIECDMI